MMSHLDGRSSRRQVFLTIIPKPFLWIGSHWIRVCDVLPSLAMTHGCLLINTQREPKTKNAGERKQRRGIERLKRKSVEPRKKGVKLRKRSATAGEADKAAEVAAAVRIPPERL